MALKIATTAAQKCTYGLRYAMQQTACHWKVTLECRSTVKNMLREKILKLESFNRNKYQEDTM